MSLAPRSIRSELLAAFLVLAALPTTVTHLYYADRIARLAEADAIRRAEDSAARAAAEAARLARDVHSAEQAVAGFLIAAPLARRHATPDLLEFYQFRQRMWQHLHNIKWVYPAIMGIHVTHWDGTWYSSLGPSDLSLDELLRLPWRRQLLDDPHTPLVIPPHSAPYAMYDRTPQRVVTFARCYNFDGEPGHETVLHVDVEAAAFERALASAAPPNGGGALLVRGESTELARIGTAGQAGLVEVSADAGVDSLRVVARYPSSLLLRQARNGRIAALAVAVVMMALALGISLWLSRRIAEPIRRLTTLMRRVGQGDFGVRVPDHPNRDLRVLAESFNRMVDEVNVLMRAVVDKETQRTRAELGALQAAINPHFLYNTLDVIRGIALSHGDLKVVDMAEALANMFRYAAAAGEPIVPLARELDHVRNYVRIQRYRHGDRCTVAFEVPEELLDCQVPRLLLQPLVENAFTHAFCGLSKPGVVRIRGQRRGRRILLAVSDNGRGIDAATLAAIERSLAEGGETAAVGIGISNVHRRIALAYGDGCGLRLHSEPGGGTTAELVLPAQRG